MADEVLAVLHSISQTMAKLTPISIVLAVVFTVLTAFFACNPGRPWWRKRELVTDLCYWFVIPLVARYLRIGLLIVGAAMLFGIYGAKELVDFYENGHGPLAQLPLWAQVVIFLAASDLLLYWIHRGFHGERMWKYHAVHHSSEDLDWISAWRFHPINIFLGSVAVDVVLLLAGITPRSSSLSAPLTTAHSAFVHANLNWTLGPFKYVLAGPVFHRWHHTAAERGGSKNFAATFPVLDLMFGTFYMPARNCPTATALPIETSRRASASRLLYPFKR